MCMKVSLCSFKCFIFSNLFTDTISIFLLVASKSSKSKIICVHQLYNIGSVSSRYHDNPLQSHCNNPMPNVFSSPVKAHYKQLLLTLDDLTDLQSFRKKSDFVDGHSSF